MKLIEHSKSKIVVQSLVNYKYDMIIINMLFNIVYSSDNLVCIR
jgi:hypothetical protein